MSADKVVRHLLEQSDPDNVPIEHYLGPAAFQSDVKDILDHALFLKRQCEEAGVLTPNVLGQFDMPTVHRALLRIAAEELEGEVRVDTMIKRLRRYMHSYWS
jgi:hypothetical protein